jgi:hypothetical protein
MERIIRKSGHVYIMPPPRGQDTRTCFFYPRRQRIGDRPPDVVVFERLSPSEIIYLLENI